MQSHDRTHFVRALDLEDASARVLHAVDRWRSEPAGLAAKADDGPSAAVDDGMLVSFVADLSPDMQADVLNSCLLAQLAANKKYDREHDTINWYGFYRNVLENIGWVVQQFSFQNYQASGDSFTVDQAVIGILEAIATENEMAVVTQSIAALKSLSSGDGPLVLWNSSTHSADAGNFQIATCSESGGNVVMKNGAFYFSTTESTDSFLWFSYSSSSMTLYQGSQVMTLNEQVYGQVRADVLAKLGDRAKTFVADLDI